MPGQCRSRRGLPIGKLALQVLLAPIEQQIRIHVMTAGHDRYRRSRCKRLFHDSPLYIDRPPPYTPHSLRGMVVTATDPRTITLCHRKRLSIRFENGQSHSLTPLTRRSSPDAYLCPTKPDGQSPPSDLAAARPRWRRRGRRFPCPEGLAAGEPCPRRRLPHTIDVVSGSAQEVAPAKDIIMAGQRIEQRIGHQVAIEAVDADRTEAPRDRSEGRQTRVGRRHLGDLD